LVVLSSPVVKPGFFFIPGLTTLLTMKLPEANNFNGLQGETAFSMNRDLGKSA
jgi:hypothetical protein